MTSKRAQPSISTFFHTKRPRPGDDDNKLPKKKPEISEVDGPDITHKDEIESEIDQIHKSLNMTDDDIVALSQVESNRNSYLVLLRNFATDFQQKIHSGALQLVPKV